MISEHISTTVSLSASSSGNAGRYVPPSKRGTVSAPICSTDSTCDSSDSDVSEDDTESHLHTEFEAHLANISPVTASVDEDCVGGTYFLRTPFSTVGVVKPSDEEAGTNYNPKGYSAEQDCAKLGFTPGQGYLREVFAHQIWEDFAKVPETIVTDLPTHSTTQKHATTSASLQRFVSSSSQSWDNGPARSETGQTCLISAAMNGYTETAPSLVGLGQVDVDQADGDHNTPLFLAAAQEHADVEVLIDAGADMEKKDCNAYSALSYACMTGCLSTVKMLVHAGADPCVTDDSGSTCLITAVMNGHTEIVRFLVGLGQVDVDQADGNHNTALHVAVLLNRAGVVEVLIDAGADMEKKHCNAYSALSYACAKGCLDIVKMLVPAGADVRVTDDSGRTCLSTAARHGHTEIVRFLVGLGQVDVDQADGNHNTALHEAVLLNHADVVEVLIDAGADVETMSGRAHSPLLPGASVGVPASRRRATAC